LGVPPGKYRVSVTQQLTREAVDKKNQKAGPKQKLFDRDTDMLDGKFDERVSPIVCEINKDSTDVVVDLDTPPARASAESLATQESATRPSRRD
jgi:hypothetical protein